MTKGKIVLAVIEAKRFIARAEKVIARTEFNSVKENERIMQGSKETGALRRASLDLTRALAEMRD